MKIEKDISLAPQTTFRIGGIASYFCEVNSIEDLHEALAFARTKEMPVFVLGGGSNVLFSDTGFAGLVIQMNMKGIKIGERKESVLVTAQAGEGWDSFVAHTVQQNLWGLENLSLIPGTVGASPVQNIGAYGVEVMNYIHSVQTIDGQSGKERTFSNKECQFSYRYSIFKKPAYKKFIITSVTFELSVKPTPNLSYKDLHQFFEAKGIKEPTQREIRDAVIEIRMNKFPNLAEIGTAGSFWKNPIIEKVDYVKLNNLYPGLPSYPFGENVKVSLAWILDHVCNLKGYTLGKARLFEKQPLVIVAESGSSSIEIKALSEAVSGIVEGKTGIRIEPEVEWVG